MKKILLIEDNVMNSELVKDVLVLENFDVTIVDNALDALVLLDSYSFHLILTDINLPKMDGIEFLRQARQKSKNSFIVAMSSDSETYSGKRFDQIGFNGFIQKPFKINELRDFIHSLLD